MQIIMTILFLLLTALIITSDVWKRWIVLHPSNPTRYNTTAYMGNIKVSGLYKKLQLYHHDLQCTSKTNYKTGRETETEKLAEIS